MPKPKLFSGETELVVTLSPIGDKYFECFDIIAKDEEHLDFLLEDRYQGMRVIHKGTRIKRRD